MSDETKATGSFRRLVRNVRKAKEHEARIRAEAAAERTREVVAMLRKLANGPAYARGDAADCADLIEAAFPQPRGGEHG